MKKTMNIKSRAIRRAHRDRIISKTRQKKIAQRYDGSVVDHATVAKLASTHGKPCSCWMDGNARRVNRGMNARTIQERRAMQFDRYGLGDMTPDEFEAFQNEDVMENECMA